MLLSRCYYIFKKKSWYACAVDYNLIVMGGSISEADAGLSHCIKFYKKYGLTPDYIHRSPSFKIKVEYFWLLLLDKIWDKLKIKKKKTWIICEYKV